MGDVQARCERVNKATVAIGALNGICAQVLQNMNMVRLVNLLRDCPTSKCASEGAQMETGNTLARNEISQLRRTFYSHQDQERS